MSWRVLVRMEDLGEDIWKASKSIYDEQQAMGVFNTFRDTEALDVMLVQEKRFSSAKHAMSVRPEDVEKIE